MNLHAPVFHLPHARSLRVRLALLFGGLFAAAMLSISFVLWSVVETNATSSVRNELVASGTVFDRLWLQRTARLRDAAGLLARDFGFRAAVASGDNRTIQSALDNLSKRMGVEDAFIIGVDGNVTGLDEARTRADAVRLWDPLDGGQMAGVATLGGRARQIVAAPIMMPVLTGWVVFAADLDEREMKSIERLSAIPLSASVYQRLPDGGWIDVSRRGSVAEPAAAAFLQASLKDQSPSELQGSGGRTLAMAKPLPTMSGNEPAALMLRYPVAKALSGFRRLQVAIALSGLLGLALTLFATWRISRSITQPISALEAAAGKLAAGDAARVTVEGDDELARLAGSFNRMAADIAERERRITHLAFNDTLTGLPNRALFHEHLDHELRTLDPSTGKLALLCLDLDNFKAVNDTLGHPVGDALLQQIATRLTDAFAGCFVARLGGDEFVVVHSVVDGSDPVDRIARRALETIHAPLTVEGHDLTPGVSIGIALAPADGMHTELLLKQADLALYRAKEAGRGQYAFFEESMNERAQTRRRIEADLRVAIAEGQFEMYFQPLFDLKNDRVGCFEALMRWHHPERGLIPPTEFIPVAEESGLIVQMGAWAIREACAHAARWPEHIKVAVNVSPCQFARPGLTETVLSALSATGLAPKRLELEITESIFLEGQEATQRLLHSLRQLGVRIALDDFGTGYSSLSYLQSFPFDKIKIDRSFIQDLLTRPGADAIVRAIVALAEALGMETTAEGVEDRGQLEAVRLTGCSSVQGYLFSRPINAGDVDAFLAEQARAAA